MKHVLNLQYFKIVCNVNMKGIISNNSFFLLYQLILSITFFSPFSVTEFLSKLNNISEKNNFFQPDFTPSDMDEIPDIYKSIIEDPVAVHDSFTKAAGKFKFEISILFLNLCMLYLS